MSEKPLIELAQELQVDCENDAKKLDGKEFNGKNVGEVIGTTLANVALTGYLIEQVLIKLEELENLIRKPS